MWNYLRKLKFKSCLVISFLSAFSFLGIHVGNLLSNILMFINTRTPKYFLSLDDEGRHLPILLWWTPFVAVNQTINCKNEYKCFISSNRNLRNEDELRAFLFYGSQFKGYDVPMPRSSSVWAIIHEESPKNMQLFLHKEGQDLFNITSTFSRYSDLPLTFQYLKSFDYITDKRFYVNVKEKNNLLSELAPVLFISSNCDTPSYRNSFVKELMKYIKVDSYGKCLNNKKLPVPLENDYLNKLYSADLIAFVARYKFTIAIENAVCYDYITEKLWRPLIAGSVPIYLGSPSIEDWLPKNSAVLIKNFQSVQSVANYIHLLNNNDNLYENFLKHKLNVTQFTNENLSKAVLASSNEENSIAAFQCYVCEAIHKGKIFTKKHELVYDCPKPQTLADEPNSWETFWEYGKCEIKAFKHFFEDLKMRQVTEEMFVKQSMDYLIESKC